MSVIILKSGGSIITSAIAIRVSKCSKCKIATQLTSNNLTDWPETAKNHHFTTGKPSALPAVTPTRQVR